MGEGFEEIMANTKNPALTAQDIEHWKRRTNPETRKKYTQSDIARMYGVTRAYVSWVKHNKASTFSKTPREIANESWPWNTGTKFNGASPGKRMRDHGEYMATGGKGMSTDKLQRLVWFYEFLESEDLVVEFDPNLPPEDGVSSVGGFAYRPRQESDGDLIIRVNEHTTLTEQGRRIWRFPPRKPRV